MQPNHVRTQIRCRERREQISVCVRITGGVPEPLRCTPGASVGGVAPSLCPECTALLQPSRLSDVVQDLTRHGWSEHIKDGAVVITC